MKRLLILVGLILACSVVYAAEYQSQLGSHDLRWGTGTWVDNGGRTRYQISGSDIPFAQDNTIKLGNTNAYNLSSGVIGNWKIPYTNGSGIIATIALDNSGLCLKSNGPANIPYFGTCGSGGGGYYNSASVDITGGSITGTSILSPTLVNILGESAVTFGSDWAPSYKAWFIRDTGVGSPKMQIYTLGYGWGSDNTPMMEIAVNAAGYGSVSSTQIVLQVKNNNTALLNVMGDGSVRVAGTMTAATGVATEVADGYRRANFTNSTGILFSPNDGDFWCITADNNCYLRANGATFTMRYTGGSTGGGTEPPIVGMVVTDDFNRTNADPAGSPWTRFSGSRDAKIISNALALGTAGTGSNTFSYWGDNTFASNQYAKCKLPVLSDAGPGTRLQSNEENGYSLNVAADNTAAIVVYSSGVATQLGATCTGTFTNADVYELRSSGSTHTAYLNGSPISGCSRTDSTWTGGRPGVMIFDGTSRVDDWEGGDL